MTYTQLAVLGVLAVVVLDLAVLRVGLLRRRAFWTAYAIIAFFQLLTNGWLTGREIVTYNPDTALTSGDVVALGDWRIVFAPVEDLMFGFALVVLGAKWEALRGALMNALPDFPGKGRLPPWGITAPQKVSA